MPLPITMSLSGVACAAAVCAVGVAAWGTFLVRGSTAVPAGCWAVAACLALAAETGARAVGGLADPASAAAARLAVVALSLCPAMSLLGAKRPQHGVWQLIVATLAVVLCLPAVSALLVRPGSLPDLHLLERCLVPLLVLVGWMNFAGTRRSVAAGSVACGQVLLARGVLPGVPPDAQAAPAAAWDTVAAALVLGGMLLACGQSLVSGRRHRDRDTGGRAATRGLPTHRLAAAVDPAFLAVRETLGAAWTLRIAERFDAVAASRGWPCRLRFAGLEVRDEGPGIGMEDAGWQRDAVRALRALLRRFVSDGWLARHGWPAVAG